MLDEMPNKDFKGKNIVSFNWQATAQPNQRGDPGQQQPAAGGWETPGNGVGPDWEEETGECGSGEPGEREEEAGEKGGEGSNALSMQLYIIMFNYNQF